MPLLVPAAWALIRTIGIAALGAGLRLLPRIGATLASVQTFAVAHPYLTQATILAGAAAVDMVQDLALIEATTPESKTRRNERVDPAAWAALLNGQPQHITQLWR